MDPTTRLLTVAWKDGDDEHVWLPGVRGEIPESHLTVQLPGVRVHTGDLVPAALCRVAHRTWIGHNSATFDKQVWEACTEGFDNVKWDDTYPLALACGLPGGLDKIGQALLGTGKDKAGQTSLKKAMKCKGLADCEPENVPLGQTLLIAKYNVQDVRITERLWHFVQEEALLPPEERRVLAAHHAINTRGCRVNRRLVEALIGLAEDSKARAIQQIAELTAGALPDQDAVQSRARVIAWLASKGYRLTKKGADGTIKDCLAKDLVARFIDTNRDDQYDLAEEAEADESLDAAPADTSDLPLVIKVLELRMQALRITGGKLDRALEGLGDDQRLRGLLVYWAAHTGRFGGRGLQIQNLPRPKEGINVWELLGQKTLTYDSVRDTLPLDARCTDGKKLYPFLSVDDAASALIRNILIPDDGKVMAAGDYAAIECRVLAWMGGEKWLMDAFWNDECPYLKMAEKIVNVPRDKWPEYIDPKTGKPLSIKKHPYRQILGKVPELACGYMVGDTKVEMYAAGMGFNLRDYGVTGADCVLAYRKSHPAICGEQVGEYNGRPYFRGGLWCQLNDAALRAVATGERCYAGKCEFSRFRGCLIVTLPSMRRLVYRNAKVEKVQPTWAKGTDKYVDAVTYISPRYGRKSLYGGSICENLDQAISRDILAAALVRLEDEGDLPVVLHCHDEAVSCIEESRFPRFMGLLTTLPDWLPDFPLAGEGSCAPCYSKSPPPGVKDELWRNGVKHGS